LNVAVEQMSLDVCAAGCRLVDAGCNIARKKRSADD
jgi:hypothetical protein